MDDTQREIIMLNTDPQKIDTRYLRHTKVLSAYFGGVDITVNERARASWPSLLHTAIKEAYNRGKGDEAVNILQGNEIKRPVTVYRGVKNNEGFRHVMNTNISLKEPITVGTSCRKSLALARLLNTEIKVIFVWNNKENAEHPGQKRMLHWVPETSAV